MLRRKLPGRAPRCAIIGNSLVAAMEMAQQAGDPAAAQIVACECVVLAETKDHTDWELIGQVGKHGTRQRPPRRCCEAYERNRGRRGLAPVPQPGMVPRAVDRIARARRGAAAARGACWTSRPP